jgi:preprotein translocase subunit SecD
VLLPAGADPRKVRAAIRRRSPISPAATPRRAGAAVDCVHDAAAGARAPRLRHHANITTLRNRVNALGVSEPIVQRQGIEPHRRAAAGVQNSAEVKDMLGKVATLEYRLVDPRAHPAERPRADRRQDLRRYEAAVAARSCSSATSSSPATSCERHASAARRAAGRRDARQRRRRRECCAPRAPTWASHGRGVHRAAQRTVSVDGKPVTRTIKEEKVINVATIQGVFGNRFMTTGLTSNEAHETVAAAARRRAVRADLHRQRTTITGTLGKENIEKGVKALVIGMAALFAFMIIYYQLFGVVANLVLLANVVVLTALLSVFGTALTLPGIAGIILTVGMAVDANVLIYERIREELRNGVSPQAAIRRGFEKAFSAIADSNVTTAIAGVVLWVFGTGAIRGFAIVLTLGIGTSMFTALMGSRALAHADVRRQAQDHQARHRLSASR